MASWLQERGLRSMHKKTLRTIWAAAAHIEGHITRELEQYMATLSESVTRLTQAVSKEFNQIREEAQAAVDAAKAALEQVGGENQELKSALQEQVSKNEQLVSSIDDAQSRLDTISGELEGNDPSEGGGPTGPTGGDGAHVDNTLPNELPVEGEPPVVDPRSGRGGRK